MQALDQAIEHLFGQFLALVIQAPQEQTPDNGACYIIRR